MNWIKDFEIGKDFVFYDGKIYQPHRKTDSSLWFYFTTPTGQKKEFRANVNGTVIGHGGECRKATLKDAVTSEAWRKTNRLSEDICETSQHLKVIGQFSISRCPRDTRSFDEIEAAIAVIKEQSLRIKAACEAR